MVGVGAGLDGSFNSGRAAVPVTPGPILRLRMCTVTAMMGSGPAGTSSTA
jgi:hypothetical protein